MKTAAILISASLLFASSALAQDSDGCDVPIRYASHNLSVSTLQRAADDMRYENECKGNTRGNSSNFGVGYSGVELKFGNSSTSTENFCRTYQQEASSRDATYQYARTVVRESLDAFVACKELSNQQVRAKFTIMPRMLVVDLARLSNSAVFRGISVSPSDALTCTRNNPDGGAPLVVDRSTSIPLTDGETTVVTCERTDRDGSDGVLFDETNVAIDTNRGSATIKLESSRYPPPLTTDQLLAQIEKFNSESNSRDTLISKRTVALENFARQWQDPASTRHGVSTRSQDKSQEIAAYCPHGEYMLGIQQRGNRSGGDLGPYQGPFVSMQIACVKIPILETPAP
jgi:hypothetical protein